jgi:regulator of cell morphogenesis and NO signaling
MTVTIDRTTPIGNIAAELAGCLPVFDRLGLDYCCHGQRSLAEACEVAGVAVERVIEEIRAAYRCPQPIHEHNWAGATMTELADHIESTHHARARETFARLRALVPRVAAAHADGHPELAALADVVSRLDDDMQDHMVREERVLFPWLRRLDRRSELHTGPPWSVRRPISCMEHDHVEVAESLARIRERTAGYAVPPDACGSYRAMIALLRDLEQDTRVHIHKENNILFPAGVRAEAAPGGRPNT